MSTVDQTILTIGEILKACLECASSDIMGTVLPLF